jgi:glyoxylase-like metal-dependent hydrolase (beta-lactamase superfamily II)
VQKYTKNMGIHAIDTGFFSTEGGAMFGLLPKRAWSLKYPAIQGDRCSLAMRALYVDLGPRKVLFDAGVGPSRVHGMEYYRFHSLLNPTESLLRLGIQPESITDVVLSHLHFDHCGGVVSLQNDGRYAPAFPNAVHWAGLPQRARALHPGRWEQDAYDPLVVTCLEEAGLLRWVGEDGPLFPGVRVRLCHGHTGGQLVSWITAEGTTWVFAGDVVPMRPHLSLACVSAVDACAEVAVAEKEALLREVAEAGHILFFYHDAQVAAVRLALSGDRVTATQVFERLEGDGL